MKAKRPGPSVPRGALLGPGACEDGRPAAPVGLGELVHEARVVRSTREGAMHLFGCLMIDANTNDLDWCADPTDLERALAQRLVEIDPSECGSTPIDEKLARLRLAREFERVIQH